MKSAFTTILLLIAVSIGAQTHLDKSIIEQLAISKLRTQFGINSKVLHHLDLTQEFQTKSQWSLIVAKQPDEESQFEDGAGNRAGAISFCFVENGTPDCSEERFQEKYQGTDLHFPAGQPVFHYLFNSDVVFSGPAQTLPLLRIKVCPYVGANGNCGVSTFLFAYDQKSEKFRIAFFNVTGRNNNQETRFIENGPLLGSVIVVEPTQRPPYRYIVDLYKRTSATAYTKVLSCRSKTAQGDGNPLPVIDSEMPELLRRLNLWKPGDPLPKPDRIPNGCAKLALRNGILWCEK